MEQGTAVGLFWEDPPEVLRDRLKGLLATLGLTAEKVAARVRLSSFDPQDPDRHVLWRDGARTSAFHQLDNDLTRIGDAALLVIDTSKFVFHDSIVDPEAVRFFVAALRSLAGRHNVAVVLVTHVNRAGDTSGTTEWENQARAVVHLKPNSNHFLLEVVKSNYAAPIAPLPIARAANGTWTLQTYAGTGSSRSDGPPKPKSPAERAREVFLEGLDNTSILLSAKRNSPKCNYVLPKT